MRNAYPLVAAAVGVAMTSGVAFAGPPSITQAAAPQVSLVIAGSSAAQPGFAQALANDLCGGPGNLLTVKAVQASGVSAPASNFEAFSCIPASGAGGISTALANGTNVFTFYYRGEGGSVTGALPIAAGGTGNQQINRLNLSDSSCASTGTAGTCTVSGASSVVGTADGFTGAVVEDFVQLGVTDVDPQQFGFGNNGNDYPKAYSTAAYGTATPAQLANLTATPLFDQVFGIFVNTSGMTLSNTTVNLSRETVADILSGNVTNWNQVPDALTGQPVSTNSVAITVANREAGSGTRTSVNVYFFGYQCGASTASIVEGKKAVDFFSTGDALAAAAATGGALTYASIDNDGKQAALVLATLNGGTKPTNLLAATGAYDFWEEAQLITNPSSTVAAANPNISALQTFLTSELGALATAPSAKDIMVIPGKNGNTSAVPIPSATATGGTVPVFTNRFTRNSNTCNNPSQG